MELVGQVSAQKPKLFGSQPATIGPENQTRAFRRGQDEVPEAV